MAANEPARFQTGLREGPMMKIIEKVWSERLRKLRDMMAKATPGPWKPGSGYEQSARGNYIAGGNTIVAAEQDCSDCVLSAEDRDLIVEMHGLFSEILSGCEQAHGVPECSLKLGQRVQLRGNNSNSWIVFDMIWSVRSNSWEVRLEWPDGRTSVIHADALEVVK
jgi:hypothetical protein